MMPDTGRSLVEILEALSIQKNDQDMLDKLGSVTKLSNYVDVD